MRHRLAETPGSRVGKLPVVGKMSETTEGKRVLNWEKGVDGGNPPPNWGYAPAGRIPVRGNPSFPRTGKNGSDRYCLAAGSAGFAAGSTGLAAGAAALASGAAVRLARYPSPAARLAGRKMSILRNH